MSELPDKQRFKVGSRGRSLDIDVRDETDALVDLNSYTSATVQWFKVGTDASTATDFTSITLVASPTAAPNATVQFTAAELASANVGRWYVFAKIETAAGIYVQPPENAKGLEIEIFE